ncbi:potassium transporter Trk [Neobacillus sp. YIM B02564]|uniref:precorrin-2 dehydrogenase n=1 Tax=Neobacillus paridis TaxID=2803862 RepID=A0ABS1TLX6_9BACI|nr:NAD(P)-dependent oxidoreductase [Neobacillus paridis]MBL4952325.1 potassium transporter Trk [Neobacillus paridis]
MLPLFINLTKKKIVIAGGGKIAARKARNLEAEEPEITFIAPDFCNDVLILSEEKGYTLIHREAKPTDFSDAFFVILATNDPKINRILSKQLSPNQLVCVVDPAEEGNVIFPSTLRRGQLQIAVTTNGASPKLTRKIKLDLEQQFDRSWETYIRFLSQCRSKLKKMAIPFEQKNELLEEVLNDRYRTEEPLRNEMLRRIQSLEKTS